MTKAEIISAEASGGGMFLVIPSVVMLDESLSLSAKMLYGIITWKSNENSCCWCTNRTFGDVLGISQKRVSALIAGLKEGGHIDVEIIRDDETGQIIRRNIYPVVKRARKISPPIHENEDTPSLKKGIPPPENGEEKYKNKYKCKKHPIAPQGAQLPDCLFEGFWKAYPRKENRAAALRAWKKLAPDLELCHIMADALRWQRETDQWTQDGGQFIPSPASWLLGRRWEDEPGPREWGTRYLEEEGFDGI